MVYRSIALLYLPRYEQHSNAAMNKLNIALSIDFREKALIQLLQCLKPTVLSLPVGDLTCSYENGSVWVMERKTAEDLASSIIDGRWAEQSSRLLSSSYCHVFFLIEGDLSSSHLAHETLLGACINAELRECVHVFRTACVEETAMVVIQLVKKCDGRARGVPSGIKPKSKRLRDSETVWIRQLMCIPSISERIARILLDHFGNLRELQEALEDIDGFPRIRLDGRTCIGQARIRLLASYLT